MSHSDLANVLSTTRLSQYLNLQELHILIKYGKVKKFIPGNYIIEQGKKTDGLYIILEGSAVTAAKILGEGMTELAFLGHGNLIGEVGVIDKNASSVSTIATNELTCLFITNQYLDMLIVLHPQTYYQLKRALANEICEYLKNFYKHITQIMQQTDMITRSMFSAVIKSFNKISMLDIKETEEYAAQLPDIDFFENFSQSEKSELLKICDLIKAPTECILIQENQMDASLYLVLYGAVQSSIIHDNKVAKLSVLGPLEIFSSISILDNTSLSIINYMTCERSILLKITQENLEYLRTQNLPIWYKVFDLICQSLVMVEKSAEKLEIRLNSELYNR